MGKLQRIDACAFVLATDPASGRPTGMAATWLTKCSHQPHIWAVAIHQNSHTLDLIRRSRRFTLAFATPEMHGDFTLFGTESGPTKMAKSNLAIKQNGQDLHVAGAHANYVCQLERITYFDSEYRIVLGRAVKERYASGTNQLFYKGKNSLGQRQYC